MAASIDCRSVHDVAPALQCSFILNTSSCASNDGFFNYLEMLYCDFSDTLFALGIVVGVILLILYFIALATAADEFFCPCLKTISEVLHLSQNIAGVTILAFGNGAPDIFSAIASAGQERPELVLGALFGAGIFVTTVVVGLICITSSFKLMERPFLRDIIFYIIAVFWAYFVFYSGSISIYESIGFLVLYVIYIIVVVVGRMVNNRNSRNYDINSENQQEIPHDGDISTISATVSIQENSSSNGTIGRNGTVVTISSDCEKSNSEGVIEAVNGICVPTSPVPIKTPRSSITIVGSNGVRVEVTDETSTGAETTVTEVVLASESSEGDADSCNTGQSRIGNPVLRVLCEFLEGTNPVDAASWRTKNWISKAKDVIQVPFVIAFNLTIPVVDSELPHSGWNRPLNCLHLVVLPLIITFLTGYGTSPAFGGFPIWALVFVISMYIATIIFLTTTSDHSPKYHWVLSFLGFAGGIIWIYMLANEIVSLLSSFGVLLNVSDVILGLTVLAWGNSIGDLITDLMITHQGFPRMGISACFGGPLLNLLVGMGLSFTMANIRNGGTMKLVNVPTDTILVAFLFGSLLSSLVFFPCVRFQSNRRYGIYLIFVYILFMTLAILTSLKVLLV